MNEPDLPNEGDEHLELLGVLGVVDEPTPAISDRHLVDLRAEATAERGEGHGGVVRTLRRRPGRVATGVIGIAAALLVVAAIDARPTTGNRAEATTLEQLATKAGDTPPIDPEHPVLHITYRLWSGEDGGDVPQTEDRPPEHLEAWRRSDGSGLEVDSRLPSAHQRVVVPPSDPDGSMYEWHDGSCSLRRAGEAGVLRTLQGTRIDTELLDSLPAEPADLRTALEHVLAPLGTDEEGSPAEPPADSAEQDDDPATSCEADVPPSQPTRAVLDLMVDDATTMLLGPWSAPKLRAAAFQVFAERNDVNLDEGADPLGRDAVAITVAGEDGMRFTTYVDPTTTEWLGLVGRDASGKRITEELVTDQEWVAEVPTS